MSEEDEKDQLIDEFPELYLHVRMEERAPRSKRLKVRGVIEICPDEDECESNWNMISVTGKERYYYARRICREITQARKKHKEILAKIDGGEG